MHLADHLQRHFCRGGLGLIWRLSFGHALTAEDRRWLVGWSLKGVLLPFVVWAVMNWGLSWDLQPFIPNPGRSEQGRQVVPRLLSVPGGRVVRHQF